MPHCYTSSLACHFCSLLTVSLIPGHSPPRSAAEASWVRRHLVVRPHLLLNLVMCQALQNQVFCHFFCTVAVGTCSWLLVRGLHNEIRSLLSCDWKRYRPTEIIFESESVTRWGISSNKKAVLSQSQRWLPNTWGSWKLHVSAKSVDDCARISTIFTILSLL